MSPPKPVSRMLSNVDARSSNEIRSGCPPSQQEVEQGTWDRFDDGDLGLGSAILNDHRTVAPVSSRRSSAPARTG